MLQQVELKIKQLKERQAEEFYKKKDEDLQAWGLSSKKNGKKVTPIIVTDDEYEALIKEANGVGSTTRNSTANLLKTLSVVVIVLGVLGGIALWFSSDSLGFVWFTVAIVASLIVAVLFKGLGEAIGLLQQLLDLKPLRRPDPLHTRQQTAPQPMNMYAQAPVANSNMAQPPIYQASSYRAPAQPYYGTPVQVPVQPVQPIQVPVQPAGFNEEVNPAYGAPQNYNETAAFTNGEGPDFSEIR